MKASLLSQTMQPLGKANKPGVRGDGARLEASCTKSTTARHGQCCEM